MTIKWFGRFSGALLVALGLGVGLAVFPVVSTAQERSAEMKAFHPPLFMRESRAFVDGHPDMMWRIEGLRAYEKQRYDEAYSHFRRAAGYADKPSQAVIAEMLWAGQGVLRDRPSAYIWMDLATERGNNRSLLIRREWMWAQLSPQEQQRAVSAGGAIFDEFADAVSKPRQARVMSRSLRSITGSNSGNVGFLSVSEHSLGSTNIDVKGELVYDRRFWTPDSYWEWQDAYVATHSH